MKKEPNKRSDEYKSVFGNRANSNPGATGIADWANADPRVICDLVAKVTSRGGAVRFGYTRDGGAYAVGFYYGQDSKTVYCRPGEDLDQFLKDWQRFYEDLPNTGGRSPEQ